MLHALKGVGNRAFYRSLTRDCQPLFPHLPDQTRLLRRFKTRRQWILLFLVSPTLFGVADSYGIKPIHSIRESRSLDQIGGKRSSNHRWFVGSKLYLSVNQWDAVINWLGASAHAHNIYTQFHPLIQGFQDCMIILADIGFYTRTSDQPNLKLCLRGTWSDWMLIETVFSMLTLISHFKKISHRGLACSAFTVTVFNPLIQWHGLLPIPTVSSLLSITVQLAVLPY